MSLRKILGGSSRVKKTSKSSAAKAQSARWAAALPRSKPGAASSRPTAKREEPAPFPEDQDDEDADLFADKLDDVGLVRALATDLNLRDTAQALRYIRSRMFCPIPEKAAGMNSVRIAELLNYRKNLPPIVTVSHIQTLLTSPSAVEREVAELARSGFLRRIVVAKRGDIGDTVMLASDYEDMVTGSAILDGETKAAFLGHLKETPGAQSVSRTALREKTIAQLVRAGFLTAHHTGLVHHGTMSHKMNTYLRPEDKGTLTSLETVSQAAAGSLGAVGGSGALLEAGGSGGRTGTTAYVDTGDTELKLAVPGNGSSLKLLSAALDHLVGLLQKSPTREAAEHALRDRWDGGIAREEVRRYAAKRGRGEFASVLPGQTRKWRQFYGLDFSWVLQEAVGSGLVEVFETRSVGRGVRLI
ncbi:serine-threonine protein kinase 19-domain-containing protein [Xylariaceae sp. FL0016]|nr:serine-threonine protein kinase 19-domain-containing protein [Xylariaceae sp. FL0016]